MPLHTLTSSVDWRAFGAAPSASAATNANALNLAVQAAIEFGGQVLIPAGMYDVDVNLVNAIPNRLQATLRVVGVGRRSSVIRCLGTGSLFVLGDDRTATNAEQDWAGFSLAHIGISTLTATSAVALEWRFSDTLIEDVHIEGFQVGVGPQHAEPKCWAMRIVNSSFMYNERAIVSHDHGLHLQRVRAYYNGIGLEISGGGASINCHECDFAASEVALVKLTGPSIASFSWIGGYLENGYASTFAGLGIDPALSRTVTPAGGFWIEGCDIFGFTVRDVFAQMQAATWFIRVTQHGHVLTNAILEGGIVGRRTDATGRAGDVVLFDGSDSSNVVGFMYRDCYSSNGLWDAPTNERQRFGQLPPEGGFGLDRHSSHPQAASTSAFNDATAHVNQGPKFAGMMAWNHTQSRPLWATGPGPFDTWVDGAGTVLHSPS